MSVTTFHRKKTDRGFELVEFLDRNRQKCSLQQSSLADNECPGTSALWLGEDSRRMHLTPDQVEMIVIMLQRWLDTGQLWYEP